MIPQLFGDAGAPLFGVYHPPAGAPARPVGVVLCHPGPQEYRQAHWIFRRLAGMLAAGGLHVLRFDYFATGDSAGDSHEGTLARWVADVGTAARELRDLSGVRRIALVGMRLGAAIAARASAGGLAVRDLVLWDPVVSGAAYLAQLESVQRAALRERRWPQAAEVGPDELLGYPLRPALAAEIAAVDLLCEPAGAAERALLVCAGEDPRWEALHARLRGGAPTAALVRVEDPSLAEPAWHADTLLAHAGSRAIATHLTGRST